MDAHKDREIINNTLYDELGERWYTAHDDPVALLRAETREKLRWATPLLKQGGVQTILDVGCGAGFAANLLAQENFTMTGLDFSQPSLDLARKMDLSKTVEYIQGDAYQLPFPDASFDAVMAFDFLEHVSDPARVVKEISRVLKPRGQFLFHTFNRNWVAWLVVIKGVEWFVKNTPKNMHTLPLFIKPQELEIFCNNAEMQVARWTGLRPQLNRSFFKMLGTRIVPETFEFIQTPSMMISYCGQAFKK